MLPPEEQVRTVSVERDGVTADCGDREQIDELLSILADMEPTNLFFASIFSTKMQIEFLKVAWGISPLLHFLRRHSFGCRRGAVAGIQSLLVTDM